MKIALVSFGHADHVLPMAKALAETVEVELFFALALNKKFNNVLDFQDVDVVTGFQDEETKSKAFSKEIKDFINGKFPIHLFIYKNLKFKSINNWLLSWKLSRTLRKYDVINMNGLSLNIIHLRIFMPFKKIVYTIHDLENHSGEKTKNLLVKRFNPYILHSKSHVVIQNKSDFEIVQKKYPKQKSTNHFIPFGNFEIYRQFNTDNIKTPEIDVLFFGRISIYKGIEYFIEAINLLKKDFPKIKSCIAGSGKFYFDISDIQKDNSFTIINKFIQSDELIALVKACKIVVCPYIDATQSGVAMTAFAFNKPIIATSVGGFKDVIEDGVNGFLVPVKDSRAIYEKLKLMLENKDLLEKMNQNISEQSKSGLFAWSTIARKYADIYKLAAKS